MINDYTNLIIEGIQTGDQIGGPTELAKILTDSLTTNKKFDEQDLRQRYLNWWKSDAFDTGPTYASVFNKIDNYRSLKIDDDDLTTIRTKLHYSLDEWKQTWMAQLGDNVIFISALEKSNIEQLKKLLYSKVREIHITRFPYNNFLYPELT